MGTYILRRVLLMFPTLIGITFLVFMLVAYFGGGIGAALKAQGGGGAMQSQNQAALQKARLEDRYGLDDPSYVQYVRWLGRVSPVQFGRRDQYGPSGERTRPAKAIKPPPLWEWYADTLPEEPPAEQFKVPDDYSIERKQQAYKDAAYEYATARAGYIAAVTELKRAIREYAVASGHAQGVRPDGELRTRVLEAVTPDKSLPGWAAVQKQGDAVIAAMRKGQTARVKVLAAFDAKPYPEVGVPIIPGAISLAPPDFGVTFSGSRPVLEVIGRALPYTLLLNLAAVPIIYFIAIPSGMLAAVKQGTFIDYASGALYIALWSIPAVLAGVLCVGFLASKEYVGAFPVSGLLDPNYDRMPFLPGTNASGQYTHGVILDTLWHMCLPVLCLVYAGFAGLSKQTRAAMLDNFSADYVRTAKAKGVAPKDVVFRHVFRNSLLPIITIFVSIFPAMLSGSVVIEKIFSIPGMGWIMLDAINQRDRELLLANTFMVAGVNLVALLLADILYAIADPRVTYK